MRVAVVGGGVSGLVTAFLLSRRHDVTLFEAAGYAGGHTNTVAVERHGRTYAVDTGFIVFNDRTYPNFMALLDRLGVGARATSMSFSVACERSGLEYNGTSINQLFVQRRNLIRPSFHGMVRDILRFNRIGPEQAAGMNGATVAEFLGATKYGAEFRDHYLVPMGASIWSCPPRTFLQFPIRFVMDFFGNHGLLQVHGRPQWRVVEGGSARYVEALTKRFTGRLLLNTPVRVVQRNADGVHVATSDTAEVFDEAVLACHADQALRLLCDATQPELQILRAFPYQENEAVLHTDTSVLPKARAAWAAWNYRIPRADASDVCVSYDMNILQGITSPEQFCVSLNAGDRIDPRTVIERFSYHHPIHTTHRDEAQRRHADVIRTNRTSFCGAYWGYGFHEDGVNSALAVCRAYGETL